MQHTKQLVVLTLLLLLGAFFVPRPGHLYAQTTSPQDTCASGEVFVDAQDWWSNPDGGTGDDFGHLHTGLCWKHKATIAGSITLRVRSVMHDNPGTFRQIQVQIYQGDSNNITVASKSFTRTCAADTTCTWWDDIVVDTTKAAFDGEAQFRVRGFVGEPDGKDMRTSTGLHAYLNNGKTYYDALYENLDVIEGRGWYGGNVNYTNANIRLPSIAPVSGIWQPYVQLKRGADGIPVTGHFAAIDTDFHNGNRGIVIKEGSGEFRGNLSIDTRTLSNGWHRLFLKADAFDSATGSTNSGVVAIYFEVRNSTTTASYNPVADAYVRDGTYAGTNYGSAPDLEVKDGGTDFNRWAYLRFDLSGHAATNASNATLKLYVNGLSNGTPVPVKVFAVSDDSWSETGLTWNNKPAVGTQIASGSISATGWISFNVTSFVSAQLAGDKNVSLVVLDDTGTNRIAEFDSRSAANKPALDVTN